MSNATNKNTFVISTKGHALHLIALATKKLDRLKVEVKEQEDKIGEYNALLPTLPETAAPTVRAKKTYEVGQTLKFNYGRKETRSELTGVVEAVSDDKKQLAMVIGSGFSAQRYTIFTGAVVAVVNADGSSEAVEPEVDPTDSQRVLDNPPAYNPSNPDDASRNDAPTDPGASFDADPLA